MDEHPQTKGTDKSFLIIRRQLPRWAALALPAALGHIATPTTSAKPIPPYHGSSPPPADQQNPGGMGDIPLRSEDEAVREFTLRPYQDEKRNPPQL